jgi:putative transposase
MEKSRYSKEFIHAVLLDAKQGMKIKDVCAKHGISDSTFYKWRSKFNGTDNSDAKKIEKLEAENQRLKGLVADLTLRNESLKNIVSKKW